MNQPYKSEQNEQMICITHTPELSNAGIPLLGCPGRWKCWDQW